jgi:hypothetical protein
VIEDIAKFKKHNNIAAHAAESMRKDNANLSKSISILERSKVHTLEGKVLSGEGAS